MDDTVKKYSKLFDSTDEKFICALGNTCAEDYLASGNLGKGFAILSDKRVYFKGECYKKFGKSYTKSTANNSYDATDIAGADFTTHLDKKWLIMAAIAGLIGILSLQMNIGALSAMLILAGLVFAFIYTTTEKRRFTITVLNESLSFDVRNFSISEIDYFIYAVEMVKKGEKPEANANTGGVSIKNESYRLKLSKLFVSPDEEFICALGNNFVENFLVSGTLQSGFAIASDKRVYFRGECYTRTGKNFRQEQEERIVDVKDITGTGFVHYEPVGLLIAALSSLITCVITLAIAFSGDGTSVSDISGTIGILAILPTIGLFIACLMGRRSLFEISFAGGSIAFDTKLMGASEPQEFQRNIRLAKDAYEQTASSQKQVVAAPPTPQSINIADELKKYGDLLAQGLISREEFDAVKKDLLSK